jgi:O-antigen/teichoic acid export membrane protein
MMLISLNTNIPRYFLEKYLGARELGFYAAMSYFQVVGTTIIFALGESASPKLSKFFVSGNKSDFHKLLVKLITISATLGILGIAISLLYGKQILTFVYGIEYADKSDFLVGIMISSSLWYMASIFGYAATAKQLIRYQPLILVVAVTFSYILSKTLIPHYGLWGAVASNITSSSVSSIGYLFLVLSKF